MICTSPTENKDRSCGADRASEANRAIEGCRHFLEALELDHEIHTWATAEEEPRDLSIEARKRLLELGWAEDPDHQAIAERIEHDYREEPLSVQVRSEWEDIGAKLVPAKFRLELTTGGPAMRVLGDLDIYGWPCKPRLQYQDWFKPWREYLDASADQWEALEWFVGLFNYGEG